MHAKLHATVLTENQAYNYPKLNTDIGQAQSVMKPIRRHTVLSRT